MHEHLVARRQDRPIGYWTKLVDERLDHALDHALAPHGLNRREWQALNVVASAPAAVATVEEALRPFLPADEVVALLARLIDAGLVVAGGPGSDPGADRADRALELSDRGRDVLAAARSDVVGQRAAAVDGLTEADYATTVRTLERIARNLGWSA
jgi:DNA-binding MarR family transcriptional regulator